MTNPKILLVVESPTKAKSIQKYLGDDYIVQETRGHMFDLPTNSHNGLGIDVAAGFKARYEVLSDKVDRLQVITAAAARCDRIYLASDPDREGEAIAWHLAEHLEKLGKPISRVLFHEITKKEILKAVASPRDLDQNLFNAQQARRILDRIVGFLVSPYLNSTFKENLSAGRVQSVAVRIVVEREREIENFIPENYWSITTKLTTEKKIPFSAKYFGKIENQEQADKITKDLSSDSFTIKEVIFQEQKKNPLPPFTTSTLQQAAARILKMSAQATMKAAQALYEAGLVTYIRTDSVRSSPDSIAYVREYLKNNKLDLPAEEFVYKTKSSAQDAHEAIRPTNLEQTPSKVYIPPEQQRLYSIIWERFVASQMSSAVYHATTAVILSSSGHELRAYGRILKSKGWLSLSVMEDDQEESNDETLPELFEKESCSLVGKVKNEKKFTKPPSRFKEYTLIKELESKGIGRPSTYAAIMQKITDRKYIERNKDTLYGTDIGKKICDKLSENFDFMEPHYTAAVEAKLDEIANGKLDYLSMMKDFYEDFKTQLKRAYLLNEKQANVPCPKCSDQLILRNGVMGPFFGCINFPECNGMQRANVENYETEGIQPVESPLLDHVHCQDCSAKMRYRFGKYGKYFECGEFPRCRGMKRAPNGKKCSVCRKDLYSVKFSGKSHERCITYPICLYSVEVEEQIVVVKDITRELKLKTSKARSKIPKSPK